MELLIPYALVNNKVKSINDIYKQDEVYCLECGEQLILRNGDKNIKHLAHRSGSDCVYKNETEYKKRGGGESYEHKYAKEFLRDNLKFFRQYGNQIIIKDGEFKLGGYKDLMINSIDIECNTLKQELGLSNNYIPDILIRTSEVLISLEIYNSNKKIVEDIENNLRGKNIVVYEIDITKMENLNMKDLFRNMKLIFSNLKMDFNEAMKPIQNNIIKCNELEVKIGERDREVLRLISDVNDKDDVICNLKNEIYNNKKNNSLSNRNTYLERRLDELRKKEEENRKCWSKCVRDWYSNKLNLKIDEHIKKCKSYEERDLLISFKRFYNGKVGAYSSCGGDDKLKEIARITKNYDNAIRYLGVDNERFKAEAWLENEGFDIGEQILREVFPSELIDIKNNIQEA